MYPFYQKYEKLSNTFAHKVGKSGKILRLCL